MRTETLGEPLGLIVLRTARAAAETEEKGSRGGVERRDCKNEAS